MSETGRCEICDWPLKERTEDGCVEGNCSYRPPEHSPEWYRIQKRRQELKTKQEKEFWDGEIAFVESRNSVAPKPQEERSDPRNAFTVEIVMHTDEAREKLDSPETVRMAIGLVLDDVPLLEEIDYTLTVCRSMDTAHVSVAFPNDGGPAVVLPDPCHDPRSAALHESKEGRRWNFTGRG